VISVSSTWYVKPAIDLTPKVIQRLDATVPNVAALQAALAAAAGCAGHWCSGRRLIAVNGERPGL
jgi:hypothetical protein